MLLAIVLLYVNIHVRSMTRKLENRISSYIKAMTIWMLFAFLFVEGLSLFHGITVASLAICWGLLDIFLMLLLYKQRTGWSKIKSCFALHLKELYAPNWILIGIGVVALFFALWTVPYNWDSMVYRLSRVAYWAQNGSVGHYANNSLRLIVNPPLGEFILLQVYLFTGKRDILFNLLQCTSYLTMAVLVYGLAKRLGCKKIFAFLSSLLFMTMPIAFGEAINTQVDLFSGIWLLGFVYLILDFIEREEKITWSADTVFKVLILGLCVAFGYLSKPCVCIAMLIFVIWLLVRCIRRKDSLVTLIGLALCALVAMLSVMGWEFLRMWNTFHAITSPIAGARQLVGTLKPNYLFMNFVKNFTFNLPNVYLSNLSDFMLSAVWQLSTVLGVELNHISISEDGNMFAYHDVPVYQHDIACNPIVMWLIVIALVLIVLRLRKIQWKKGCNSYSIVALGAFLLFCVVLRWEAFVTRYMLSFLALCCPAICIQLQNWMDKPKRENMRYVLTGAICILALLDLGNMVLYHRNICVREGGSGRPEGYFVTRKDVYEEYVTMCDYMASAGFTKFGIWEGGDCYEYPFWAMLGEQIERMEHVIVPNESAMYIDHSYVPECIIWMDEEPEEVFVWNGQSYETVIQFAENMFILTK